ncbi:GDSL esterase/lipase family [Rhynchospora pubera]|uniref:GDSL esterase/lipase family n=1 Tax=Rhynchospora pubera TaxID=906938 RepID=A0AAV8DHU0_9POAL|nr:GDSL esterase/lipase family [Rhynchospora pubera]
MGLVLAFLLAVTTLSQQVTCATLRPSYKAIFNFGDSFSDTGNVAILAPKGLYIVNPPYGETYFNRPTGRASNGRVVLDFIVISYADYYQPITEFLAKPTLYGFTVNGSPLVACCGAGGPYNYNSSAVCGQSGVAACPDPTTVNWDGIAFTEKAYNIIANGWRNGLYAIPPI